MQVALRLADRVVEAIGDALSPDPADVVEPIDETVRTAIEAALRNVLGDGGVVLSPDHQQVSIVPPSDAWVAARAAKVATAATQLRHRQALGALAGTLVGGTGDLAAIPTIAAALQAGTPLTPAQRVIFDRFLLRVLVLVSGV